MTSQLDALRDMTVVVADTSDIDAVRRLKPTDCTTNPSIVLKAMEIAEFADTIDAAVTWGKTQPGDAESRLTAVGDRLATAIGVTLAGLVPGRISTEVDASLSFDTAGSVIRARAIIADYAAMGVDRDRVLVKLAATWEGIRAAEILQAEGIDCNMTLVFHLAQARACADAGAFLISPFVGRITDWYTKSTGTTYTPETDPGVLSVREIYKHYKSNGIKTVVMGASFRSTAQILALAGCDRLTISPTLLQGLAASETPFERQLKDQTPTETPTPITEQEFRWAMNEDAMATELLASGIRGFAKDLVKLRDLLRPMLA
ncbi:MAG: transaldolase [Candidatus Saccharibacteria bacterium]|nr:transaldolase [Pseudorhodobacter sp.]